MTEEKFEHIRKALLENDNSVLTPIYHDHAKYCKHYLTKNSQCSIEDAEDIFIEAIMNFRQKVIEGKLDDIKSIKNYLYRTCYNMLLVRLQQQKRWNHQLTDIERFYYNTNTDSEFDEEKLLVTRKAWEFLNEKCKDLLHYVYVEKLKMTEIAELMGFANSNVAKTTKLRCYQKFVAKAREYFT